MWMQRRQTDEEGMSDVNMTPLIDVSLVLVVILLLATPLAFESSFGVRKATSRKTPRKARKTATRIRNRNMPAT